MIHFFPFHTKNIVKFCSNMRLNKPEDQFIMQKTDKALN